MAVTNILLQFTEKTHLKKYKRQDYNAKTYEYGTQKYTDDHFLVLNVDEVPTIVQSITLEA